MLSQSTKQNAAECAWHILIFCCLFLDPQVVHQQECNLLVIRILVLLVLLHAGCRQKYFKITMTSRPPEDAPQMSILDELPPALSPHQHFPPLPLLFVVVILLRLVGFFLLRLLSPISNCYCYQSM